MTDLRCVLQGVLCVAGLVSVSPAALAQTSVTLGASADNTIYSDALGNSNGQGASLFAGTTSSSGIRRALIRFDLSAIPAHAPIASVTLTLHMNKTVSGASLVGAHRLFEDWGEGVSNAGDPGGFGTSAAPGDATWNFAFFSAVSWTSPGGVFDPTPSATTSVDQVADYSWSSGGLKDDVQSWVDAPDQNFGWILIGTEADLSTAKRFDSSNSAVPANRPRLVVEYYCPADFDQNGFVNGDDFDLFVDLFYFGEPAADWDRNQFVNGDDFDGFTAAFIAGC